MLYRTTVSTVVLKQVGNLAELLVPK